LFFAEPLHLGVASTPYENDYKQNLRFA
jgi:hypothetical protein